MITRSERLHLFEHHVIPELLTVLDARGIDVDDHEWVSNHLWLFGSLEYIAICSKWHLDDFDTFMAIQKMSDDAWLNLVQTWREI